MRITLYVLHGAWNAPDYDGETILKITDRPQDLERILGSIASSHAIDYVHIPLSTANEQIGLKKYEISGCNGRWARFYITEHHVELSALSMHEIYETVDKKYKKSDIQEHLRSMYELDDIEPWKYEYAVRNPSVIENILWIIDKTEDSNVSYNDTMDAAIKEMVGEMILDDEKLEFLWEEYGDVLVDDDECILDDFLGFKVGTYKYAVWDWFDKRYSKGVAALIY